MDLSAIALQGVQQADAQLEQVATKLAAAGAASPGGSNLDITDLSAEMIALMSAQNQSSVNLNMLKTAGEIQKSVIDILA